MTKVQIVDRNDMYKIDYLGATRWKWVKQQTVKKNI